MNLIETLRNDPDLQPYFCMDCTENEVAAAIDTAITMDKILIIKVDDFYNNQHLGKNTPKSIDCLIVQLCDEGHYHVYLVELKNVKNARQLTTDAIREKFQNTLFDFMSDRFRNYFYDTNFDLQLRLILIAGSIKNNTNRNFNIDFLQTMPPFRFANKRYAIEHNIPIR
jgi:hypothetical protein